MCKANLSNKPFKEEGAEIPSSKIVQNAQSILDGQVLNTAQKSTA